jgi:hypothetical protein
MATNRTTIDHERIRQRAAKRGAKPVRVKGTSIIRLDIPGYASEDTLEQISWDEWFRIFEENNLAVLFQERTADGRSGDFNKLVDRNPVELAEPAATRS